LVIANSAMLTGHAIIMLWLTQTRLGGFGAAGMLATLVKLIVAASVMGGVVYAITLIVSSIVIQVVAAAMIGGLVYLVLLRVLRVPEVERVWQMLRARARRS